MKLSYIIVLLITSMVIFSCNSDADQDKLSSDLIQNPVSAEGEVDMDKLPKIEFKKTVHDFGKIINGVKVAYKFKFTNTGGADLIISQVKTDCGCTVSRYPQNTPIAPGKSDYVELTFSSAGRPNFNHKKATVVTNAQPNVATLEIKATVVEAENL